MKLKSIGTVVKHQSPLAKKALLWVKSWGRDRGVRVVLDKGAGAVLKERGVDRGKMLSSVDALVVLGGDGTFLGAAREATGHSIPLLGVNLGSLGYITEVALDEMETALDMVLAGKFEMEKRMLIEVSITRGKKKIGGVALNEAVFSRKTTTKMVELDLSINRQHLTKFRSDGLIVSTPTGSTAYALSSGGPILYPTMDALLICPISPHTLTNRPVVIPGGDVIEIKLTEHQKEVIVTLDGHISMVVEPEDRIILRRYPKTAKIIKVPGRTHFDTLRNKLGWGGSPATASNV